MKTCKRILSLVLALVLLLTPMLSAPVFAANETDNAAENTLYIFDLGAFLDTLPGSRVQYDYLKFATALQGLANRDGARIYYKFWQAYANEDAGIEIEDEWLEYLTEIDSGNGTLNDGTDLADYEQVIVTDFWQLVEMFADVADGLVIWEEDVPSTANVASTIAGVENLLPVRLGHSPFELYSQLLSGDHGKFVVKRSLVGLFDGKTIPTFESSVPGNARKVDTSVASTGSIKTDPYIWAKVNYLDKGKTNPNLMTYSLDAGSYQYPKTLEETLGCDAEIVSTNLPSYLQAGTNVKFTLNVKNTGTTTWTRADFFRLGLLENNQNCPYRQADIDAMKDAAKKAEAQAVYDEYWRTHVKLLNANGGADSSWFNRVMLPDKVSVAPGETYTFEAVLIAPEKTGAHELEFFMIQDGTGGVDVAGKFGEQFRAPVMVVEEVDEEIGVLLTKGADCAEYLCANDANLTLAINNCIAKEKDEAYARSYLAYETEGTVTINAVNTGENTWRASDNFTLDYNEGEIAIESDVAPGASVSFEVPVASGDTEAGDTVKVTACLRKNGARVSEDITVEVEVLPSFGAEFVSCDTTDSILVGGKTTASVTWRNTGAFRWGDSGMSVSLGSGTRHVSAYGDSDDESKHAYNHAKISVVDVSYGETYTFRVDVHAEPYPLKDDNGKSLSRVSNGKLTLPFTVQTANSDFQNIQFSKEHKVTWTINENAVEANFVDRNGADVETYPISIDSYDIPDTMQPGEIVKLNIKTTNTGDEAWYSNDHVGQDHVPNEETGELCPNSNTVANIRLVLTCSVDNNGENAFSLARNEAFTTMVDDSYVMSGLRDFAVGDPFDWTPYLRAPSKPGVYTLSIGFDNPRDGVWYDEIIEKVIFVGEHAYAAETVCKTDSEAPVTTSPYTAEIMSYHTVATVEPGQTFPFILTMKNTGTEPLISGRKGNEGNAMRLSFGGATGARDEGVYLPVTDGAMADRFFVLCNQTMNDRAGEGYPYGRNVGDYNRMDFGENITVGSGEYFTFSGSLVAPTTPGTYTIDLRPVQDGISMRGDNVKLTITVAESADLTEEGQIVQIAAPVEAALFETFDVCVSAVNYGQTAWTAVADPAADDGFVLQYTFDGETKFASVAETAGKLSKFNFSLRMPREGGEQPITAQMYLRENGALTPIGNASTLCVSAVHSAAEEIVFADDAEMTGEEYTAEILSVTVPETVKPGEVVPISLVVKNTGSGTLYSQFQNANTLDSLRIRVGGAAGYLSAENKANKTPDALDENYLMSNKFFVLTDGTKYSRDEVEGIWLGAGNREYCRIDLMPNQIIGSGDTATLKGWLVAPSTEGPYELIFDPISDLTKAMIEEGNKAEKGAAVSVNIDVTENGAKPWEHEFYEAEGSAIYTNSATGLFNSALPNADYYIANKAFFWDLSQESDIAPKDDRDQAIGTDVKTLRSLLLSQMKQAQKNKDANAEGLDGSGIFTVGGFVPWVLKYNSYADEMSDDTAVDAEWGMIDIISEYGGQTDADAFGTVGIINTSVYQHVALNVSGSVNPTQAKPEFNPEVGDASVEYDKNTIYLMFYMGDYDGGSWVGNLLKPIWDDPERGTLPLAWAICGNLADRVPQVYNYLYETAKPNDYFVTGDNGTGYLNPQWMLNPRDTKITSADISENRDSWIHYNTEINEKFKLGITGFYISATRGGLDDDALEILHKLTPYGVTDHFGKVTAKGREHYGVYTPTDAADGTVATPFTYTRSLDKLNTPELIDDAVDRINKQVAISGQFLSLRTVKALPSEINDLVEALQASTSKTVKVVDPYTYFRLYKEVNADNTVTTFPSLTLVGSNISFGDQLSIVMSYNLNNMPAGVTADYLKQNAGLLSWTNASDASACNTETAEQSVGLTAVPANLNAGQYAGETVGFTAKEASVYRYIRAYVDMPDGTRVYSAVKGYSPKLYANAMLDNADASDEMKDLAKTLLNYAAAAQKFAGVTADANRDLSAADRKLVFDENDLVAAAAVDPSKTTTPDHTKFWAAKKNIRMKDNFNLLYFWQMDPAVVASASDSGVLVWTQDQYLAATEISLASAPVKYPFVQTEINGVTHYGAEVVGIPARSIDQTIYACAYMTIDGVTYYSDLVNYSVHQYAQNKLNDANMGELVKRVVNYGQAAKAYYESVNG